MDNTQSAGQTGVPTISAPSVDDHRFFGIDISSTRITVDDIVADTGAVLDIWHVKPDYAKPLLLAEKGKELTPSQKHLVGVYINLGQLYI